ncbi:DMT family transporter [Calidifontibacter terrae]
MAAVTHDARVANPARAGLLFALISAASFGMSGSLARGLLDTGWSPAAAVLLRITVASVVLTVPSAIALHGRWGLLRDNAGLVVAYGVVAVAGCQVTYFYAVRTMPVAMALLVEYVAPIVVVGYLWVRHGQRPSALTTGGALVAIVGLVLVLDLVSGASADVVGMLWALGAMVGAATYFVLGAKESTLPPLVLAGGGLWVGSIGLAITCLLGLTPFSTSGSAVAFEGMTTPWWVVVLTLGVVTAALAYVSGIAASRALGSRVSSFVALLEVLFSLAYARLLLGQQPGWVQLAGGLLILAGVVLVKIGEPVAELEPAVPDPT